MNAVNQTVNCVNSSTTGGVSLQQSICDLIAAGLSNPDIVARTGARPEYVRAVRSRVAKYGRPPPAQHRGNAAPEIHPHQPNLRELALKLYAMRQEDLL